MKPIPVPGWWDMFTFTGDAVIECPDCGTQSEPMRDVLAAAMWVQEHYQVCPA